MRNDLATTPTNWSHGTRKIEGVGVREESVDEELEEDISAGRRKGRRH
jgi:hypothetical protein